MKKKKKEIVLLLIGILTLVSLVVGATYAFFKAQTGPAANSSINATSGTTDNLTFTTTGEIVINASASNFGKDGKDLNDSATATATLIPNNTTNNASDTYNVYLLIEDNDIEYSRYSKSGEEDLKFLNKEEKAKANLDGYTGVPELYLTITTPEGKTTNIEGLNRVKLNSENDSYDITEKSGLITIARNVKIEATGKTKIENWNITITLKNLDSNQQLNTGKSLKGKVIIQKEELIQAKLLADANKIGQEETLLYHNGTIKDENGNILDAEDYSYRYSGSKDIVNNYVCFGSNNCVGTDELYQIIGLFKNNENQYEMKIIKATYATDKQLGTSGAYKSENKYYYWNYSNEDTTYEGASTNDWSKSNLNNENLNTYYLYDYLQLKDDGKWYKMIVDHNWITEGNTNANIYNQYAKKAYENEILNPDVGTVLPSAAKSVPAKVGLMYASDYGYSTKKSIWETTILNQYNTVVSNNWMYMNNGIGEWTITRQNLRTDIVFAVGFSGYIIDDRYVNNRTGFNMYVRPCIYLNSNVKITSGSGTSSDPYIISQ